MISINPLPVVAISLVAWIIFRVLVNRKSRQVFWLREILLNVMFIYGWVVITYTLFPLDFYLFELDFHRANLVPLVETIRFLNYLNAPGVKRNLLGNLLLLAPLGVFLPILYRRFRNLWAVLGLGFVVTLMIELAQLTMRYRVFDIDDLILNLLGVAAGFGLFALIRVIPGVGGILDRITNYPHTVTRAYGIGFIVLMLLGAVGITTTSFLRNTETPSRILSENMGEERTLIGQSFSGKYLTVLSQGSDGWLEVQYYRSTLFNRYALISDEDQLTLNIDTFKITGLWNVGEFQDIFVIARSQIPPAVMVADGEQYPVDRVGEYSLSIGRFLIQGFTGNPVIGYLDSEGNLLQLTKVQ